jgi:prefoldin alpha subunit
MEKRLRERQRELREEREEKGQYYQNFVDETLKPDLQRAINQRESAYAELGQYLELKNSIEQLANQRSVETLVNLGHEFFIEAKVPDTSKVIVDVGLGFMVEFAHAEALDFLKLKETQLEKEVEKFTNAISNIRSRITLILRGLEDLANVEKGDDD